MSQVIDTSIWVEFRIGDVFEVTKRGNSENVLTGASVPKSDLIESDSGIPRVSASGENNGLIGTFQSTHKNYRVYSNFISVSFLGAVFYQSEDASLEMKVHALKPVDHTLGSSDGLFLATAIRAGLCNKFDFSYAVQISSGDLADVAIQLPATSSGEPDWDYMAAYMDDVASEAEQALAKLESEASTQPEQIDISQWAEFKVGDLFEVTRPTSRSLVNYNPGDVPFIASGNFNNGVSTYVEPHSGELLDAGNCITVSPLDGSSFYQPIDFLGRGGAGSAIIMLRNSDLTAGSGLFIAATIRKALTSFNYSNQLNKVIIANQLIPLPTTSTGEPDWDYMDNYMRDLID